MRSYIEQHQILFVFFASVAAIVAWYFRYLIALAFASYIIATGMQVVVLWLQGKGLPRWGAIVVAYFTLALFLLVAVIFVTTSLAGNLNSFVSEFPSVIERVSKFIEGTGIPTINVSDLFDDARQVLMQGVTSGASALFGVLLAFVASVYLITRWDAIHTGLVMMFGSRYVDDMKAFFNRTQNALGHWIIGQLSLSLIVGTLTFIGLTILGIPFAAVLAVFTGFLEIVPNIGPIVAAVPAILVGLSVSSTDALLVTGLYVLVQQLENNLITPLIMKRAVHVDPLLVIFGTLAGLTVAGVVGALLSVPLIKVAQIAWATFIVNDSAAGEEPAR